MDTTAIYCATSRGEQAIALGDPQCTLSNGQRLALALADGKRSAAQINRLCGSNRDGYALLAQLSDMGLIVQMQRELRMPRAELQLANARF
jgi:hypothetical protein